MDIGELEKKVIYLERKISDLDYALNRLRDEYDTEVAHLSQTLKELKSINEAEHLRY